MASKGTTTRKPRAKRSSLLSKDFSDESLTDLLGRNPPKNDEDAQSKDDDDKHAKYEKQMHRTGSFSERAVRAAAASIKSSSVDAFLCASSCAGSLALLQFLTTCTGGRYKFFDGCLVGSAIKFFHNETPPSLRAFIDSTMLGLAVGITFQFVPTLCGTYARHVLLFLTFFYWKLYGSMWTSANTLALLVAMESGGWASLVGGTQEWIHHFPWQFFLVPYILGHLILYGLALLVSLLRRKVRIYLIQREFVSRQLSTGFDWQTEVVNGAERRQRLRRLFQKMDTSGDGTLDVIELQVALRAATGTDISMGDTKEILQSVDSDGNGCLDFDEFCSSVDKLWPQLE